MFIFTGFEELATRIDYQIMPENYKESKKKELLDLIDIYENDLVSYFNNLVGEGGKTIRFGLESDEKKDYLRKHRAELAKKNNPIEQQK